MGIASSTFVEDDKVLASLWEVWKTLFWGSRGWTRVGQWLGRVELDPFPPRRIIRLDLSDCRLEGPIPSQLGRLSSLQMLDLSDNQLTSLPPPEMGNLRSLRGLFIGGNN
ncbi:MAG: leucine-rich repeat domain-containing protein [Candidatus Paceibacterota bacterium]|jgi:hypothetical protein